MNHPDIITIYIYTYTCKCEGVCWNTNSSTNRLTMEEDYQAIYPPTITTRSDYVTKTIDGELIDINKLEMNEINSTESIELKRGVCRY